ncbi:cation transporter [Rubrobacter xylanophilus DSM 9941]|uniref:Cation transporter n=1 Tax=Rubrobacter xylanophilus (strain DSM 9941 / JCM 11954 / NBRC 16129 / PRD-1) TaxID=266117 RepID=Q1AWJ3_RUBXD|nr:potassium transporter TrkG [Rubrobacter xylanophilus]ABG04235.1 cation transporter [Rubrobacter xylanophilus DSM 9941]
MHPRIIANVLGAVVAATGAAMLIPAALSRLVSDGYAGAFFLPAAAALLAGTLTFALSRGRGAYLSIRDVFLMVVLGWVAVAIVGSGPFVLSGLMSPVEAFFNSMAGFTTTGVSTVKSAPPSLLLWRSMSQWVGGIGIVLLFVAVAPLVGFGAAQLYSAEAATPLTERLTPRIRDTAKVLVYIYAALTAGLAAALLVAGMGLFDAVNHALTTVATGGYSTRPGSIAAFDSPAVELVLAAGMILSGTNFALYFQAVRGRLREALTNAEYLTYLALILSATAVMAASLYAFDYQDSPLRALRLALFQSASLTTGTGFSTADWDSWDPLSQGLLMVLMAIGGCAGSTSGGIKVVRALLLAKNALQDAFRMVHPRAVTALKLGRKVVPERLRASLLGFFFVYVATLVAGTLLMALHQVPLGAAFGSAFACLNITGVAPGPAGDPAFYAGLPATAQLVLCLLMLLGRLELFTVLVILTPAFWRG